MQTTVSDAPMVLSIRSLRKDRAQDRPEAYSLRVPRLALRLGEKLLITGPSGSGKSTLLDMIGMVLTPDSADEFLFFPEAREGYDGNNAPRDISHAWKRGHVEKLAGWRRHVGYVLQTGGLLPFITVRDNIGMTRRLLGMSPENSFTKRLVQELGIKRLLNKLPAQLSVGERQRVAIARALAGEPALVLADEPTAALDPKNAANVLALFTTMVEESGSTLIMVTHAPEQMAHMGFRRLQVTLADDETESGGTVAYLGGMPQQRGAA